MYDFENSPRVSAFSGYKSAVPDKIVTLLRCLTTDKYKDEVERYRNSNNASERKRIKSGLPCITVSGIFSIRDESEIVRHSGCICLDIDGKDQADQQIDWEAMKELIGETFDSVYFVGLSIGGNGIYIVAKIRNPKYHKMHYRALAKEIESATGLKVDPACCDIPRLRGASYDPTPYHNANATQYNKVLRSERKSENGVRKSQTDRNRQNVEDATRLLCEYKIDITEKYKNWLKIAVAIYDEFGEDGRKYFHLISCIYEGYYEEDCDRMYDKAETWGTDVRIKTFFYFCKKHGIIYRKGGMAYDPTIIEKKQARDNLKKQI